MKILVCFGTRPEAIKMAAVCHELEKRGVQEEVSSLSVPIIVTREITEHSEGIEAGASFLVGEDINKIVNKTSELLMRISDFKNIKNPYGDGTAAVQIVNHLSEEIK